MTPRAGAWADAHRVRVQSSLDAGFGDVTPIELREALLYPLRSGGKRIRPLLCMAAAEAIGGPDASASGAVLNAACAVELVHTYSLVHDDLPAMDDDDLRRGLPTVHRVYGEAVAILVGDALLTEAFARVARWPGLVELLAEASGARGMVGGQFLDIRNLAPDLPALMNLHRRKTGALIGAAVRMGGHVASVALDCHPGERAMVALGVYGDAVGLAFQVADDLLDADQDAGEGGPPSCVRLLGRAGAQEAARELAERAVEAARDLPHPDLLEELASYAVGRPG